MARDDGALTVVSNPIDGIGVFQSSKNPDEHGRGQAAVDRRRTTGPRAATAVLNDPRTKVVQLPYYLPQFNSITKSESEPLYPQVLLGQLSIPTFLGQLAGKLNDAQTQWRQRHGG